MKIPIYEEYDLSQFRQNYPRYPEKVLERLHYNYNVALSLFTSDGHLVLVELNNGHSFTAVIRGYDMLGCEKETDPLNFKFELREQDFIPPEKIYHDESKFIKHDIRNIKKIDFIQEGKEHLSDA